MVESINLDVVKTVISDDRKRIGTIRAFLCDCYVNRGGWQILEHNPSKIRVANIDNRRQLVDDYDHVSKWFSLSYHNRLIACARLCSEDENGLLELERYPAAKRNLKLILSKKRKYNIIELNREAVHPLYFKREVFLSLLNAMFIYCIENKHSIITTTSLDEWVDIYQFIGFPELKEHAFKYHDIEPHPVKVYFADRAQVISMAAKLQVYLENGGKYAFKTSCVSFAEGRRKHTRDSKAGIKKSFRTN